MLLLALSSCTVDVKVPPPSVRVDCLEIVVGQRSAVSCDAGDDGSVE
jgi:hypothetical protein